MRWLELPSVEDERGFLTAIENGRDVPFDIKRLFYIHHIQAPRGGHAHRDTDQVLIAVAGSFKTELFDGRDTRSFLLEDPTRGLFIPRMTFVEMDEFSPGAVGLVLADTQYDAGRSLRSREQYLEAIEDRSATRDEVSS